MICRTHALLRAAWLGSLPASTRHAAAGAEPALRDSAHSRYAHAHVPHLTACTYAIVQAGAVLCSRASMQQRGRVARFQVLVRFLCGARRVRRRVPSRLQRFEGVPHLATVPPPPHPGPACAHALHAALGHITWQRRNVPNATTAPKTCRETPAEAERRIRSHRQCRASVSRCRRLTRQRRRCRCNGRKERSRVVCLCAGRFCRSSRAFLVNPTSLLSPPKTGNAATLHNPRRHGSHNAHRCLG